MLTISGKTPIENAFGRRPPDLLHAETATPAQLSEKALPEDRLNTELQRLAIQVHASAKQHTDVLHDLSLRLRPSEGVFQRGDRVFYWFKDASKIKDLSLIHI